ncbi:tetratricopeptide repeat protein [Prochlorococcus marinus]|uniref:tetratricopeptide repeat protein n=1 Tax=Prochlorococcus marinus TaxID=1219 RepID=UPI0022B4D03B|nr:tetratricopeptide repeat protein [Prochlorococcus marinus]
MEELDTEKQNNKKATGIKTFNVPFALGEIKEKITITTNTRSKNSPEQIINQAINFHQNGKIIEAIKHYQNIINLGFADHRVFSNYGVICRDNGKLKDAEVSYRKAIELKTDFAEAHYNLGNVLRDLGELKDAEFSYLKAIELKTDFANAHLNLGIILKDLGKPKEAKISFRKAIELKPDYAEAHSNLANVFRDLGELQEAELSINKVIELRPDFASAHLYLGIILRNLGKSKEAEISIRKAIEIKPDYAEAYSNMVNLLKDLGKSEEAKLFLRNALGVRHNSASFHLKIGAIFIDLGELEEAEKSTRKAIEIQSDYPEAYNNLGTILKYLYKPKDAEKAFRKAIELNINFADAYFNLSLLQLLHSNYQSGLDNYEFRFKQNKAILPHAYTTLRRHDEDIFKQGEKLLIISEQGLGDTLQFMRYIPYLKNQGLDISFCAQEKLHSLIKASGIDSNPLRPNQISSIKQGEWIQLLSIPKYLKVSPQNPIITNTYIIPNDKLIKKWEKALSLEKKPIIGINWQGNPETEKGIQKGRSLALELFSTIASKIELSFISLQKGVGSEQLEECSFKEKFVNCQREIDIIWDFHEMSAIISNCDIIITSDTSVAHLAGGMGKNVWLLLRDMPEWRWGLKKETTFWYPSMKLFRQKERYNWREVIERVSNKLKAELNDF